MVWHIKKTSIVSSVGTVYYKGENRWTAIYENRKTYASENKTKDENYIWDKKTTSGWDVTAVNEDA